MLNKAIVLLILIVSSCYCEEEITTYSLSSNQVSKVLPSQLITQIANAQPEIVRKAVSHFLTFQLKKLQGTHSSNSVKEKLLSYFTNANIPSSTKKIKQFIKQCLLIKFEMKNPCSNPAKDNQNPCSSPIYKQIQKFYNSNERQIVDPCSSFERKIVNPCFNNDKVAFNTCSSFDKQINEHPEDYFITYDMYDLLID